MPHDSFFAALLTRQITVKTGKTPLLLSLAKQVFPTAVLQLAQQTAKTFLNTQKALTMIEHAANSGCVESCVLLSTLYDPNARPPHADTTTRYLDISFDKKSLLNATQPNAELYLYYLQAAIDLGDGASARKLAFCYLPDKTLASVKTLKTDVNQAIELFKQAALLGCSAAIDELVCVFNGHSAAGSLFGTSVVYAEIPGSLKCKAALIEISQFAKNPNIIKLAKHALAKLSTAQENSTCQMSLRSLTP